MKKTIMSLAVVSALFSAGAMAATTIAGNGQSTANDASQATLNFSGKLTSSLCQVATDDITKDIQLGEISKAALIASGRGPSQSFSVKLKNCDSSVNSIKYTIRDTNGDETTYITNKSGDDYAKGVGVYLEDAANNALEVNGHSYDFTVAATDGNALPDQEIPLAAHIGTLNAAAGDINNNSIMAGIVNASAVMTIKATAATVGQ
ncbi:fimbrial protein [Salmonella enterica subsp. enterica serovar Typhimurium]|nr:fimbrial protein [Salmonella enterica subsp. enterica serovar Typhimurium]EFK1462811.1 type 1 fimbrial protein [Escherichia coli]EGW7995887.1 type 1 fimbrial protein [Salmonella enterica]EJP9872097.1 type 1 fimbrial protein [Salmonella enterica]MJF13743.1 type 1 fimbrial protein [Salmonella enterica subsp. enterica]